MVEERLVAEKGSVNITRKFWREYNKSSFTEEHKFYYRYKYWFNGVLFYIGKYSGENPCMVEAETGGTAVHSPNGDLDATVLVNKFKELLIKSGMGIQEVIYRYKVNYRTVDIWLINLLII